jgi:rSAM/selenodomain-associated transferase 1
VRPPRLALVVLAKAPVPGQVKTRLCPRATPHEAAGIAAAALLDTLDAVRSVPGGRVVVALAGRLRSAVRPDELAAALNGLTVLAQRGADLGHRIAAAHRDVAALLPGVPSLLVGMDTPQLDPDVLGDAADQLRDDRVDALLGPAADGGWWALGLRDPRRADVLRGVATSRDDTGERTAHALLEAGLRLRLLPELRDVDTVDDALAVAAGVPHSRFARAVDELPIRSDLAPC